MANIKTFKELQVWKKAHELALMSYKITYKFPKSEIYGLTSQIKRASVSVSANIVEGFRRKNLRDSINFYRISVSSLEELKYHFLLSKDLNFMNDNEYKIILQKCEDVGRLLTRWIQSQDKFLG